MMERPIWLPIERMALLAIDSTIVSRGRPAGRGARVVVRGGSYGGSSDGSGVRADGRGYSGSGATAFCSARARRIS